VISLLGVGKGDAMAKSYRATTSNISRQMAKLRADIPDTMSGFSAMARAATRPGTLDTKTKELIALALGVAAHCDGCIGFHMQALMKAGASRAEITEALAMAVYMGGGPSVMYAAEAMSAYDELSAPDAGKTAAAA
jgi:AhpD family alkylhydroperoxidase